MTLKLSGKVALITGTAGGQGRAAALLFAAEGAKVIGCDLNEAGDRETVAMVNEIGGEMSSLAPLDLTDEAQVKKWIDFAVRTYGDFDILYNNASSIKAGSIESLTVKDWQFALDNELTNLFLTIKHALPVFQRRGQGVILNIASVAGIVGAAFPGNLGINLAHNVTKAGVLRMTQHLAIELSPWDIRVNSISPGTIRTPGLEPWFQAFGEETLIETCLIKRVGQPEDIARAALFLVSDDASYITGTNLTVDGGWVASGGLGRPNQELASRLSSIIEQLSKPSAE